jgi:multiple sugar transport system ATP-binding protein
MAEVVLSRLAKVFAGNTVALEDVNLTVADGEFVVLVGPSGCGKSTLLRVVAGLEDQTAGTVSIDGVPVDNLPPKARDIAMVFQNYALYPHMSVEDNMSFGLRIQKVPKSSIKERVLGTAKVLGLDTLLERKPRALSGGQRQRVAMGRAIVRQPKVYLMDEPLSNLDAKLRVAMRGELMRLHQRYETTTIYVTHDQIEAMTLGDRIAVLNQGRLQQVGTPEELYRAPCNVFVAGFIGSPAMNLARGRIERTSAGLTLVAGEHRWVLPASQLARRPALAAHDGGEVIVGLRPCDLDIAEGTHGLEDARIEVTAVTVESLGDEKNILFLPPLEVPDVVGATGDASVTELTAMWTANVSPGAIVAPGDRVTLALNLAAAYFFDAGTGVAIDGPCATGDGPAAAGQPLVERETATAAA